MATGADLPLMRRTANLSLDDTAKYLGVSGLELHLLEQHGRGIPDEAMAGARTIYRENARKPPAEPRNEYVPGIDEQS